MASGNSGSRRATTRKKTAVSKKTGGRNTGKRAAAKRREEDAFIRDEVIVLVLFAVSILLLLSNFGIGGAAGNLVSSLMFGLFGVFAYVLPVVLFLVTAFSISNRDNTIAAVKVGAMIVAGFLLCALFQLVGGAKDDISTAADFYTYSRSYQPFLISSQASPRANAPSVPGLGLRCRSASLKDAGVIRESTIITFMPLFFAFSTPAAARFRE